MVAYLILERVGVIGMIPKIVHYCWFGKNEKPKLAKKCIASWKKYCPDYEIIEWNEDNFDIQTYPYAKYCYEHQKYAFLSDFVRLIVIYQFGGIYFDTDVELLKSPNELLEFEAFYGFENDSNIATGLGFGSIPGHPTLKNMCQQYMALSVDEKGDFPIIICPELNTKALLPLGLALDGKRQNICGAEILPSDYLNPYDDQTGRLRKTSNTISVHWYSKSWLNKSTIIKSKITKPFHRIFGIDCFQWLKKRRINNA